MILVSYWHLILNVFGAVRVFQPFQWSGTLFSNFDCSGSPWEDSWGPKGRNSRPKAESGGRFLGRGQRAPSPPARGLGEHCKLPIGVWAGGMEGWVGLRLYMLYCRCRQSVVECLECAAAWSPTSSPGTRTSVTGKHASSRPRSSSDQFLLVFRATSQGVCWSCRRERLRRQQKGHMSSLASTPSGILGTHPPIFWLGNERQWEYAPNIIT